MEVGAAAAVSAPVRIFVGAGMSFDVPRDAYDEAQVLARQHRRVVFVGLMPVGCMVSMNRHELMREGAIAVSWITPGDASI
jgi:hypothetical protein